MGIKESVLKKAKELELFSVIYKKDNFIINNQEYPLGYTSLLSQEVDWRFIDTEAFQNLTNFTKKLLDNDFNNKDFEEYHRKINTALDELNKYKIFKLFNIEQQKEKLDKFFTEEKVNLYVKCNRLITFDERTEITDELMRASFDLETILAIGIIISSTIDVISRYSSVVFQLTHRIVSRNARTKNQFAEVVNDFFDDPYMSFIFPKEGFNTRATVVPVVEKEDGVSAIYRKVFYNNLKDFLITDLFEGYINGHYLWRCDICNEHFFMTTAHKQFYCSTVNPKYGVPCSYIAKHPEITKRKMNKQRKSDSPYYELWKKRNNSIRKNKSLGKYSEAVSAKAKEIIDINFERTRFDFEYAENQYAEDMKIENIYKEAMK